ncbi:response regulator [Xinfangfangia sp. CPCC 101601]|uniref:Response regulator n=1 Tax=Pseudogemmobacter lacusdianii TaxID=3069608 RepID=A0ABU0VTM8_9RHOB|nr:response regulator [Xinfangfangia sp. CPCC 101601]MDQ2065087.1 response regulator [Xinfangfangia sp. CPCC 101601]
MNATTFRPVDVLRQIESRFGAEAETVGATFEAFSSLGCEKGREGEPDALAKIVVQIIGDAPFTDADSALRLKFSAKVGKPVMIDITASSAPLSVDAETLSLIESFGGTFSQSNGLSGNTVKLSFPFADAELMQVELEETSQEETASLAGTRILIADDSPTNRLVLEEMLADTRAELVSVNDGKEALEAWQKSNFDLLLLDISMPVMDGVTAIREIRAGEVQQSRAVTPAIAVTANALVNQVADYLVAGFDTHLAKPFRRKDLMHAILTLLRPSVL